MLLGGRTHDGTEPTPYPTMMTFKTRMPRTPYVPGQSPRNTPCARLQKDAPGLLLGSESLQLDLPLAFKVASGTCKKIYELSAIRHRLPASLPLSQRIITQCQEPIPHFSGMSHFCQASKLTVYYKLATCWSQGGKPRFRIFESMHGASCAASIFALPPAAAPAIHCVARVLLLVGSLFCEAANFKTTSARALKAEGMGGGGVGGEEIFLPSSSC